MAVEGFMTAQAGRIEPIRIDAGDRKTETCKFLRQQSTAATHIEYLATLPIL